MNRVMVVLFALLALGLLCSMAVLSFAINAIALAAVITWLMHWRRTGSPRGFWLRLGADIPLWLYWAVVIIGAFTIAIIPDGDRFYVASQGKWIFFFYALVVGLTYFEVAPDYLVRVFIFLSIPIAAYGIFQSVTGIDWVRSIPFHTATGSQFLRGRGFNHNPMTYGHLLATLCAALTPFLLFRLFKAKPWLERTLCACLGFLGIALILTFTRGAWVAVAAQAVVVLLLWNWRRGLVVLAALAVLGTGVIATVSSVHARFSSIGKSTDQSTIERIKLWRSNWMMFKDHPILGVGAGRNQQEVRDYNIQQDGDAFPVANAHNNFLHLLAGTGVLGFIFWLVAMLWLFVDALKRYFRSQDDFSRALQLAGVAVLICFQVGGLTQTTFDDTEVRMLAVLWLAMGIANRDF